MVVHFDAVRLFIFVLILWTVTSHFLLWISTRTLQCLLRRIMPQRICTLPG